MPTNKTVLPLSSISDSATSSPEEDQLVIVNLDFHFRSKLLTNFYKIVSKFKLDSNIIVKNNRHLTNEIIYHTKHSQFISSLLPPHLLYRGSRDGFKSEDFHSRCDNQGPTLTIIQSAEPTNQIFGGFTTKSWNSHYSYRFVSDASAFLFKIIDDENSQRLLFRKFNIKHDMKQFAIYIHPNCLPRFGSGHDISICSDCNLNNNSFSNFGFTTTHTTK